MTRPEIVPSQQSADRIIAEVIQNPLYGFLFRSPEYAGSLAYLEPQSLLATEQHFRKTLRHAAANNPAIADYLNEYQTNHIFPIADEFGSLTEGISPDHTVTFTVHPTTAKEILTIGKNKLTLQGIRVDPNTIDISQIACMLQSLDTHKRLPSLDPILVAHGPLTRTLNAHYELLAGRFVQASRDIVLTPFPIAVFYTTPGAYPQSENYSEKIKTSLSLMTWLSQMDQLLQRFPASKNLLIYHPETIQQLRRLGASSRQTEVEAFIDNIIATNPERERFETYRQVRLEPQTKATIIIDGKEVHSGSKDLTLHTLFTSLNTAFAQRVINALGDMGTYTRPIYDELVSSLAKGGEQAEARYKARFQIAASLLTWQHRLVSQYIQTSPYLLKR